jgi:hypothetical protein
VIPYDTPSVTLYTLSKPNVAWRSILLTSQTLVSTVPGGMLAEFANAFAEPYAIRDAELFLSGVGSSILTGRIDPNGDKPFVIASVVAAPNVRSSLDDELKVDRQLSDEFRIEVLRSSDGSLAAAFFDGKVIAGDTEAVAACLRTRGTDLTMGKSSAVVDLLTTGAEAVTIAVDKESAQAIANVVFQAEPNQVGFASVYTTETRFSRTGIQRRTTSDFGLIGQILSNLVDSH